MNTNPRKRPNITPAERAEVVRMKLDGKPQQYISKMLGMNPSSVSRILSEREKIIEAAKQGITVRASDTEEAIKAAAKERMAKARAARQVESPNYVKKTAATYIKALNNKDEERKPFERGKRGPYKTRNKSVNTEFTNDVVDTPVPTSTQYKAEIHTDQLVIKVDNVCLHFSKDNISDVFFHANGSISVKSK